MSGAERLDAVIVMPAFNEVEGIAEFVREIQQAFSGIALRVIVVDDASTDGTADAVRGIASASVDLVVNVRNAGHGPSTLRALGLGLATGAPAIIAVDGDGQFLGSDILAVHLRLLRGDVDVVEGVRLQRVGPLYRRAVSEVTRVMVRERAGVMPGDANTPLRAYRPESLGRLLAAADADWITPNLQFSAVVRMLGMRVAEVPVANLPRRGSSSVGTMWDTTWRRLPSRRFLAISAGAALQWRSARARERRRVRR